MFFQDQAEFYLNNNVINLFQNNISETFMKLLYSELLELSSEKTEPNFFHKQQMSLCRCIFYHGNIIEIDFHYYKCNMHF